MKSLTLPIWLLVFTIFFVRQVHAQGDPAELKQPNILFLFADDQRCDTIGYYGNEHISTPNLDALAKRGVNYTNAYCMGSIHGAVCQPSRAMLHSGRTLYRVPMDLKDVKTLGQVLGEAGYTTFATGKWHNGKQSFARSFQSGNAIMFGGMSNHLQVPVVDMNLQKNFINQRSGDKYSTKLFADASIEFLKQQSGQQPWFCYVSFTAPHDPRQPPEGYADRYYQNKPPLPKNFLPQHPFDTGSMQIRDEVLAPWPRTESVLRDQLAEYYGMISYLDEQLGHIIDAAQRDTNRETIIVYSADHGLALGSHGLLGKQNLYEHSMKAPLIIASTKKSCNAKIDALVYLHDLFPTICHLAQIQTLPANVEGRILPHLLPADSSKQREALFTCYADKIRAIRDERYKLIRWPQINKTQLFDLITDPDEIDDLSADPVHRPRIDAMMELLRESQNDVDDPHPLIVENPKQPTIDLTGKSRQPDNHQPDWIVEKYFKK
jgi:arylsulfatase A-like enzyme